MSAVAVSPSGQAPRATRRNHTWLEDLVHGCFTVAESAAFVVCYVTALASAARGVSGLLPLLGVAVAVVVIVRVRKWQASVWDHQRALAESTDFLAACIVIGSTLHNIQMLWYEPGELLPDLGHSLIPEVHPGHPLYALSDALADFVYPVLIVYVLFFEADSRVRVEIARLNCMRVGAVHLLRGLVVIGTSLPGPALHCRAGAHLHVDVADGALALFTDMGQVLGLVKTCGDLIFSGHAATLMVQLLLMYPYLCRGKSLMARRAIKVAMSAYAAAFTVLVVACRKHYSADVAAGFVVAWVIQDNFDDAAASARRWLHKFVVEALGRLRHGTSSPQAVKLDFDESQTRELWT